MVDNSFLPGARGLRPIQGATPGENRSASTTQAGGAAFQSLLEKLENQARDLARASEAVDTPLELAGAVDSAKESLAGALSLSDRLLEAYRAAQQGGAATDSQTPEAEN